MSDKEIIIKSLERVERRIWTNRLLNELALGATFFLAFPLALKVWDLFDPLRGATIAFIAGIWILLFAAYVVWRSLYRATLRQAAAVIDRAAGLNDEIKTAFWFIHNPRPSEWVDFQIHRASISAKRMNLDTASIRDGQEELARELAESDKLEPTAEAMKNKELNLAADELRKLAEKLGLNTPESNKQMQKSLQQASENPRLGLEELAKLLKEAAENLKNEDQQGAQQSLDEAAQELDSLEERLQSQELKNLAAEQLQNLQQSLRQRQQAGSQQGRRGQQGQAQGQKGQGQRGQRGQQQNDQAEGLQFGAGTEGEPTDQAGLDSQAGAPMPGNSEVNGLMPSGKGGSDAPREGAATTLDVKHQQERIKGVQDQGKEENIEEVSKQERSKLDYRNVKSELSPAQKDLLNQDRIPGEYRTLIKNYFQAIRPPAKK